MKPRETIFQFGAIATTMTADPVHKLEELFAYYVERQFATQEEYREAVMTRRLAKVLTVHEIISLYHEKQFGNDLYHVRIPFVREEENKPTRGIKPLDLDKAEPTRIIEYGDKWRMRIERLRAMESFPEQMLFVVRQPPRGKRREAAEEIRRELENEGALTLQEGDKPGVLEFARAV